MTYGGTQMQTQEADGWSLTMFINPKRSRQENGRGQAKRSKPDQSPEGTEGQTGSWSRQVEWSGRRVQRPETGKGQNRED